MVNFVAGVTVNWQSDTGLTLNAFDNYFYNLKNMQIKTYI